MKVAILGAGGHGLVVADMLRAGARVGGRVAELVGFLDDDPGLAGTTVGGIPVVAPVLRLASVDADAFIVAVGSNTARARLFDLVRASGRAIVTVQHPHSSIGGDVIVGDGTMVCSGVVVVVACRIGCGVILNTGTTVDHHSEIGDFAHLAPGVHLGGEVSVGAGSLIGIGAVILPRRRIGAGCTIGAGAVVVHDVPDGVTVVGVPARALAASPVGLPGRMVR